MTPTFPVSPEKQQALDARLQKLGIREEDLDEQFIRSSGPGGQHVNKASTCVVLTHRPSGLSVRCEQERSQGLNRFIARRRLADKLEEQRLGRLSARQQAIEKIRRQKRRRSRRSKEKMLQAKHHRSSIKEHRRPVGDAE